MLKISGNIQPASEISLEQFHYKNFYFHQDISLGKFLISNTLNYFISTVLCLKKPMSILGR